MPNKTAVAATCSQIKMELIERQKYKLRNKMGTARTLATLRKKKDDRKKS